MDVSYQAHSWLEVIAQSLPKAYKTILFDVLPGLPIQKSSHYSF
jgi:hypothetical protein